MMSLACTSPSLRVVVGRRPTRRVRTVIPVVAAASRESPASSPSQAWLPDEGRRNTLRLGAITLGLSVFGEVAASSPAVAEDATPATLTSPTGVRYQVIKEGAGNEAQVGDYITFDYVLRRSNGYFVYSTTGSGSGQQEPTKFAQNFQEEPVTFKLGKGQMIAGLDDILLGAKVGQRVRALVPPEVGYVSNKLEPQPPSFGPRRELSSHANQNLFFEIEVRKVVAN